MAVLFPASLTRGPRGTESEDPRAHGTGPSAIAPPPALPRSDMDIGPVLTTHLGQVRLKLGPGSD